MKQNEFPNEYIYHSNPIIYSTTVLCDTIPKRVLAISAWDMIHACVQHTLLSYAVFI